MDLLCGSRPLFLPRRHTRTHRLAQAGHFHASRNDRGFAVIWSLSAEGRCGELSPHLPSADRLQIKNGNGIGNKHHEPAEASRSPPNHHKQAGRMAPSSLEAVPCFRTLLPEACSKCDLGDTQSQYTRNVDGTCFRKQHPEAWHHGRPNRSEVCHLACEGNPDRPGRLRKIEQGRDARTVPACLVSLLREMPPLNVTSRDGYAVRLSPFRFFLTTPRSTRNRSRRSSAPWPYRRSPSRYSASST